MKKDLSILAAAFFVVAALGPSVPAVRAQSNEPAADVSKMTALLKANDFRQADKLGLKILAAVGAASDPEALAICGLAALKAGRVDAAGDLLRRAVALSPGNLEAHLGLGRIARIRNDTDAAIAHFRLAVPSAEFYEEALRHLWRAVWDRGAVDDLASIRDLAAERYARESKPLFSLFTNGLEQVRGLAGKRLFEMTGRFDRIDVPLLVDAERAPRIRMISLNLNGKGEYPFDIDSASVDFLTVSPLLAEELGLPLIGNAAATGVGTDAAPVRFSTLDTVVLGPVAFRNVPVLVSDIQTFRGLKKGLLGTGFLKRFNVTIDVEAERMVLYPLDKPGLLRASIDRAAVTVEVPLLVFDQTVVEASVAGAPPALYILDSAASAHLMDAAFFAENVRPKVDPARIVRSGIRGAQGAQYVNRIDGVPVALGTLVFEGQNIHEFPMGALNMIGGRYAAGLIGNHALWPYRVHMDFKNGRLILEKRAAAPSAR